MDFLTFVLPSLSLSLSPFMSSGFDLKFSDVKPPFAPPTIEFTEKEFVKISYVAGAKQSGKQVHTSLVMHAREFSNFRLKSRLLLRFIRL